MKAEKYIFTVVVLGVIHAGLLWAIRPPEPFSSFQLLSGQDVPLSPKGTYISVGASTPTSYQSSAPGLSSSSRSAVQQLSSQAGGGLSVRWNAMTNTPHLVTGRPIPLTVTGELTRDNIQDVSLQFVDAHANLLKISPSQLRMVNSAQDQGIWYASFQQVHQGLPVFGSYLTLSFTRDNQLAMLGSDIYPDIIVETKPVVSKEKAISVVTTDCQEPLNSDRISDAELCILPVSSPRKINFLLCWKLSIYQSEAQKKWHYLIDAVNGNIAGKYNGLVYDNITGTVQGYYKPEFRTDIRQLAAFPYENVSAQGPEIVIASWNLNTNPSGWSLEGGWRFGIPTGSGSYCGDPTSGYTGNNVFGYNLDGDYPNSMPAYSLITPPINCTGYGNVKLEFMRWLGVESSSFDNASIEVSNAGVNWTTIWANDTSSFCDGDWVRVSYDISDIAANQPLVLIRWVMGATDGSVTYPGWNIDDIRVVSTQGGVNTVQTQVNGSYSVSPPWNPAVITSELAGLYCDIDYGCGADALFKQPGVVPGDIVNFTWNDNWYNEIVESNVYWHVNFIHDFYMALDPSLGNPSSSFPTGINYPMPVTVQAECSNGYCNAYWDGQGLTFGAGDGSSCDDFGMYSEIVYHEYTHGVTEKIYDGVYLPYAMEGGAMNEGWSDYFACLLSPSQSPLVGDGGLLLTNPEGFRTLENTYRRETDWLGEVHVDSQMFSGSLWETRQIVNPEIMDELVHFARYAHPQTFEDYLLAILMEDDIRYGDSDLSNGTPHGQAIYTAFGNHGLGGLQYVAPSIVIDDAAANHDGRLDPGETIDLSITLSNGWANAANISATVHTTDPYVTIVKETAGFPNAVHGDLVDNTADPFTITLSPDCPPSHTLHFSLDLTADGPYPYSRDCLFTYTVAVDQLVYDDGQADRYLGWGGEGGGLAIRVTPDSYPCYPTDVRLYASPYQAASIAVTIWDDDGPDGTPGTVLGTVNTTVNAIDDWVDVDISDLGLIIPDGSIYVGWIEGTQMYINGVDTDPPYYQRSYVYYSYPPSTEEWIPFESAGVMGNLMVRVRYSDTPPFHITPPYEFTWMAGQPVTDCLNAERGQEPYHDWQAINLPGGMNWSFRPASYFVPDSGLPQGWQTDDGSWNYILPFTFEYFGVNYNSVRICSNGFIDFASTTADYTNTTQELIDNVRISPLWDDLYTYMYDSDDIYIDQSIPGRVTIRWEGATLGPGTRVAFAIVLFENGNIRFDYGPGNTSLSPTVGLSAGNGTDYIIVPGYDGATSLTNARSVLFTPQRFSPLPPGVTLNPDTGCFEGTPLTKGFYTAIIEVTDSNEPARTARQTIDIEVKLPIALLECDFEEGLCGLTIDNDFGQGSGLWHTTTQCESVLPDHSAPTSLYYGVDEQCDYDAGNTEGVVTTPVIHLPTITNQIEFTFNYYLETEGEPTEYDQAMMQFSVDGGPFIDVKSNIESTLADPSDGWQSVRMDLTDMAGSDLQIRFAFRTMDEAANDFKGFYIDDIEIRSAECRPITPIAPVPYDGAMDVPVDTLLEWDSDSIMPGTNTQIIGVVPTIYDYSSAFSGRGPEALIDGDTSINSYWLSQRYPQWVIIDYGEELLITGTRLRTYNNRAYQFTIEASNSPDSGYVTIVDRTDNTDTIQPISDDFPAIRARYIRITVTGASGYIGSLIALTEFEIVGSRIPDPVTYDVYLGTDPSQLNLIESDLTTPECDPALSLNELLLNGRVYYWQVVAKNLCGEVACPVWSFTTENTPPVAEAGDDQTVFCWIDGFADVSLDGSESYDADGQAITCLWTWTIVDQSYSAIGISPTINLPVGIHTITLVVNDGKDDSEPDQVVITAEPAIEVSVKCTPKSLNCESNGKWIKAHFTLPAEYQISDINTFVPWTLEPLGLPSSHITPFINDDGLLEVEVAFDRNGFCQAELPLGINQIRPAGSLTSGHYFYGIDSIRILDNRMEHLLALAVNWLEDDCRKPDWCDGLDVNMDTVVDLRDFASMQ